MKIVHLIDYFQPKIGYQEYFLAREHARLGHDVTVVTSSMYFPFPHYDETYKPVLGKRVLSYGRKREGGILTIRLPSVEVVPRSIVFLSGLKKVLKDLSPDILFCHGVFSLTSYRAALYKRNVGYKLVYDTHATTFNTDFTESIPKKIYFFLYNRFIGPKIVKEKDGLFAVGNAEREFLSHVLSLPKESIPIINLGVDTEEFRFLPKMRLRIRKEFGIGLSDILIICSGKISPNKHIHTLIQAVNALKDKKIRLLLMGGGGKSYIRELNELDEGKYTIYHQFVSNSDLPSYYSAADIGCWPGDSTISIVEALSNSLPVILPVWYGTSFLDESGGVARFHRGNPQELLHVIKNLAYNKTLRKSMGMAARRFTKKHLSWSSIAKQTIDFMT